MMALFASTHATGAPPVVSHQKVRTALKKLGFDFRKWNENHCKDSYPPILGYRNILATKEVPGLRGDRIEILYPPSKNADLAMEKVPGLKELRLFYAVDSDITDQGLTQLSRMPNVEEIWLFDTNVSGQGFSKLSNLTHLIGIDLIGDRVNVDDGVIQIGKFSNLRTLQIRQARLSDKGIKGLGQLYNLEMMSLDDTDITDAIAVELIKMTKLTGLSLAGTKISDATLPIIAKLDQLESLSLTHTSVSRRALRELKKLTKLEHLSLGPLDSKGSLKSLASLKAIKMLSIKGCHLSNSDIEDICQIKQLTVLSLDDCTAPPRQS